MVRLLLLVIVAFLLVSCGGGNPTPSSTTTSALTTTPATADDNPDTLPAGWDPALLGVWEEVSDTAGNPLETCQFNENGNVACSAGTGQDQIGTWAQVDASHIRFGYNGASAVLEYHIDGKKLTFSLANPSSTQVYEKE
jgi:hypothetical protein